MDRYMTHGAGLVFLGLIVERRNRRRCRINRERVAFQTEQVDVAAAQQPWIGRTMRRMAGHATFGLDWRMLKGEWTGFVSVAIEAELVLRSRGTQLVR